MSRVSPKVQLVEAQKVIRRLEEELAVLRSRAGPTSSDYGVVGRQALSRIRDVDFPELAEAVESIPEVARLEGRVAAQAYCRTHIRSYIDVLAVQPPRTADLVRMRHRIHMMLSGGQADLLSMEHYPEGPDGKVRCRCGQTDPRKCLYERAGIRSRMELLEVVERYCYSLSIHGLFSRGAEVPAGIMPVVPGG